MKKRPNILLITIDCLRADHVSCLGYEKKTTPNIDKLAEEGVLFKNAIANGSNTYTSFYSILTSTYPFMYPDYPFLSRNRISISEILAERDYKTAAFTNKSEFISKRYGYNRGFKEFFDIDNQYSLDSNFDKKSKVEKKENNQDYKNLRNYILRILRLNMKIYRLLKKIYHLYKLIKKRFKRKFRIFFKHHYLPYDRSSLMTENAIKWLDVKNKKPFFLWVHYMDPHPPLNPPKEFCKSNFFAVNKAWRISRKGIFINEPFYVSGWDVRNVTNLYDGEISYVDSEVNKLISSIREKGIIGDEDTYIILTADHGHEIYDHGRFDHVRTLYEEVINVPLIIIGPGVPKGKIIDKPVELLDLPPTILDLLSITKPKEYLGTSLLSLINNDKRNFKNKVIISEIIMKDGNTVYTFSERIKNKELHPLESYKRLTSARTEKWKLIINEETNEKELYNLEKDPGEKTNLYNLEKEIAERLEEKIQEHIKMEKKTRKAVLGEEKIKKIKSNLRKKLGLDMQ